MKLTIISHTPHFIQNGIAYGWGPTVREINFLSKIFKKIYHVAPFYNGKFPGSYVKYNKKVVFIPIIASGGSKIVNKLEILLNIPHNLKKIHHSCLKSDLIHFRCPTNLGLYVLPYLKFINKKKYWIKYAGNWSQSKPPISYYLQKFWLEKVIKKEVVTINGKWSNQRKHIYSFENPCYSIKELNESKKNIFKKSYDNKIKICFVGAMEIGKGVDILMNALSINKQKKHIEMVYFIGDGSEKKKIESMAFSIKDINTNFKGYISRKELNEIYKYCHILILPSKSEGFPKVVSEAISYGCVPIVSDVGSISQYINEKNGVVLKERSSKYINIAIEKLLSCRKSFKKIAQNGIKTSNIFTYEYYIKRIKSIMIND